MMWLIAIFFLVLKINSFGKEIIWESKLFESEKVKFLINCPRDYHCKMEVFSSSGMKSS